MVFKWHHQDVDEVLQLQDEVVVVGVVVVVAAEALGKTSLPDLNEKSRNQRRKMDDLGRRDVVYSNKLS